ncbi:ABC transporter, permease protein [Clostridiaceae bacterium JG1575]|nr:ABC transporter, permease protein [Clostridiaceae bacterium JG1575]
MRLSEIIRSALKALIKNKRRTILTMLGIIIGIASVITIMALGKGFQKAVVQNLTQSQGNEVVVNILFQPKDRNLSFSSMNFYGASDVELVLAIPGVRSAKVGELDRGFTSISVRPGDTEDRKPQNLMLNLAGHKESLIAGRLLDASDEASAARVVMISKAAAQDLYGSNENAVGRSVLIKDQLFLVVGLYEGYPREMVSMNLERFDLYMPKATYNTYIAQQDTGNNLMLTLGRGANPSEVANEAIKQLELHGSMKDQGIYQVFDLALMMEGIGNILSMITYFISAIAGISLFIAGVGVMNMMYISVSERTKEIGIRRAMGATQSSIRNQFLAEGLAITLLGGFLGFLFGVLVASVASRFLPFSASVDLFSIVLTVVVSVTIGLVFSVMPANAAARKDLIDILR